MIKKVAESLCGDCYTLINARGDRRWTQNLLRNKSMLRLTKINYSFVQKNKNVNRNIYNMNCIELYRYSCLLQRENITNATIYKQINKRVEMIYKFLNPSKIILLIKLYIQNAHLNTYQSTFHCLIEVAITKLNEFHLEEIVKLYNIISKVENNQNVVYLFKYVNNHLINNYTFIDVKSFSIILNSHAKLKIKDMKLINKFLHIILQKGLQIDIVNYSLLFNAFYKLKLIGNDYVNDVAQKFLGEIDAWRKREHCASQGVDHKDGELFNADDTNGGDKTYPAIGELIDYSPHHICNILLYFTIQNINQIVNSNATKEEKNEVNLTDNEHISFLLDLIIKKKNLLKCEEILMLCQIFKMMKMKNDILVSHIEKELLTYFNNSRDQTVSQNSSNKTDTLPTTIQFTDGTLVKILFDMCTFYNNIDVYNRSVQHFLHRKIDFSTSLLLLYIYSEINLLHDKMISLLIHIIKKHYVQNFQVENVFLLVRSFYKICLNSQYYFGIKKVCRKGVNTVKFASKVDAHQKEANVTTSPVPRRSSDPIVSTPNGVANNEGKSPLPVFNKLSHETDKNECTHEANILEQAITSSVTPPHMQRLFLQIESLVDNVFFKLEKDLLNENIPTNERNLPLLCKILYYATVLRRFPFINSVIILFTNKESSEIGDFKNILNILHAYSSAKSSAFFHCKINQMDLQMLHEDDVTKLSIKDTILTRYNFIINMKNLNKDIKNMIYFLFAQSRLNDYRYVNVEVIKTWLTCSFLNIHLLAMLLCSLMSKELNVIRSFHPHCGHSDEGEKLSPVEIPREDPRKEMMNSRIAVKKDIKFKYTNLYNQILLHIDKLISKCENVYDITRIFNSSFIFLNHFEKLNKEKKICTEISQMKRNVDKIMNGIEKNILQNLHLYNKEFIVLLSAICIYNNNYSYLPFSFFFQYFDFFTFKNHISYLILQSTDEEIKHIANEVFALTNYDTRGGTHKEDATIKDATKNDHTNKDAITQEAKNKVESFYSFHISCIIEKVGRVPRNNPNWYKNGEKNLHVEGDCSSLTQFQVNHIINIYKQLISKNDFPCNDIFKKVKEKYLHAVEMNLLLLRSLSLDELNDLCLSMLKKKVPNIFLFKWTLKRNYEYIHSEDTTPLTYDYIVNLLNICINLKRYNLFMQETILSKILLDNSDKFDTLPRVNKLIESLLLLNITSVYDSISKELLPKMNIVYEKYFSDSHLLDLNEVLYFLFVLYNINKSANFYCTFENFWRKFIQIGEIKVYPQRRYNFGTSLNSTIFMAKNVYTLSGDRNGKQGHSVSTPSEEMKSFDNEYVIHLGDTSTKGGENKTEDEEFAHRGEVQRAQRTYPRIFIKDHSFVTLFLLLDLLKNDSKIEHEKAYQFCLTLFKDYIYLLNKEVVIQCLYIYFYTQINEELTKERRMAGENNSRNENIQHILNVLITFSNNLDVYSILKLSFIYINLFIYARKKYHVKENVKILFEQINKKKSLIEQNNMLYEQVKRYEHARMGE
ncbi:conserved Plasmodium protein, unknown function [Plasmodium knowlesi strain H]|uniref:Uncharacterized protein n=3 Tax=Plasmodium knowlesi TaxID=5850 RepID=A0A5K1VEZ8_PLAKH|nr:conserved Plasmodium protein, unknown function [Plasmodium knowlesi strain H]OTN67049.1 Uncharacterized protein PKNOH_S07439900 [Plasmodium knowlesi]CAA9988532.1 conserved Plasmodium protein, unknown function [Plasmodium knowlesi strain H]SBO21307.1 conserved Plasmodium protein, unknown function [Plasmodium knowlesi strain H]SBO21764.1 conserved Plasmodium protein, unknown function [Plasmodium knowlesi strain H]VVS78006.1 conserved Plasmodium protein, unknown function [Plasmodium knowlesi s|eukprot:XP_002259506.1 hypothetical protein, conserved in Plasmodium species [Plasmodium knowlesi strain H]